MRGRGSDDVALEVDQAARGTSENHHEERVCKAEVAGGTGGERLTSTGLRKEEFAARVPEERAGGGVLYGGYCTEGRHRSC